VWCELRVAVNGVGDAKPLYLDLATFDAQAEACAKHLVKGRQVGFTGRLVYREWTGEDGTKRSRHSAVGRVEFLGAPPSDGAPAPVDEDAAGVEAVIAVADADSGTSARKRSSATARSRRTVRR
jgi:single-stranded DNA-binding protein